MSDKYTTSESKDFLRMEDVVIVSLNVKSCFIGIPTITSYLPPDKLLIRRSYCFDVP